jgi:hypothetical protein
MCFTVCNYVFNITLGINSDYFPKQYQRFVFEMQMKYVPCEVGTELLHVI